MRASGDDLLTEAGLTWRPLTTADLPAWAALLAAAEQVDRTGENYDADDLAEELADPNLDAAADTVAVFDGDRMIGYALVYCTNPGKDRIMVHVDGCVHPEHRRRGLGRRLQEYGTGMAAGVRARRAPELPGELHVRCYESIPGLHALAKQAGLRPTRWFYDMERDLAEPITPVPIPAGLRLAGYQPEIDEQLRIAHNEAFADHWGSVDRDQTSWRQWFTGTRTFRPEETFLLWDDARDQPRIAGYLMSYEYEADTAATGIREAWVGRVGTRPPYRGRGVASALLTHALSAYVQRGYLRAGLDVDSDNQHGALGLYQRIGFVTTHSATTYTGPLG